MRCCRRWPVPFAAVPTLDESRLFLFCCDQKPADQMDPVLTPTEIEQCLQVTEDVDAAADWDDDFTLLDFASNNIEENGERSLGLASMPTESEVSQAVQSDDSFLNLEGLNSDEQLADESIKSCPTAAKTTLPSFATAFPKFAFEPQGGWTTATTSDQIDLNMNNLGGESDESTSTSATSLPSSPQQKSTTQTETEATERPESSAQPIAIPIYIAIPLEPVATTTTDSSSSVWSHRRYHKRANSRYVCRINSPAECHFTAKRKAAMLAHLQEMHSDRINCCFNCETIFETEDALHAHVTECATVRDKLWCVRCQRNFGQNYSFKQMYQHWLEHHHSKLEYVCAECKEICDNYDAIRRHYREVHPD